MTIVTINNNDNQSWLIVIFIHVLPGTAVGSYMVNLGSPLAFAFLCLMTVFMVFIMMAKLKKTMKKKTVDNDDDCLSLTIKTHVSYCD